MASRQLAATLWAVLLTGSAALLAAAPLPGSGPSTGAYPPRHSRAASRQSGRRRPGPHTKAYRAWPPVHADVCFSRHAVLLARTASASHGRPRAAGRARSDGQAAPAPVEAWFDSSQGFYSVVDSPADAACQARARPPRATVPAPARQPAAASRSASP